MASLVIRRFDVFRNPAATRPLVPYLVVLQSHLLPDFPTLVVAPLRLREATENIEGVHIPIEFEGRELSLLVTELTHIPRKLLGPPVGDLAPYEYEIARALDRLFTGF